MELSVIIVSFNVRDYLKKCLLSVRDASERIECEIFVIDNNSSDSSCAMISLEFPDIILIRNSFNAGFSAANNQGIIQSKGRYILLLNPDTIIEKDTFSKCIKFMNEHPSAGAMGVRMINGDGNFLPESKRKFPDALSAFYKTSGLSYIFPSSRKLNSYYLSDIDSLETSNTEVISGAFMFLRHEALNKAGNMDEDYFMYGEDIDLSYKIVQAGYSNYYYPEVQITHFKGRSTSRKNYTDIKYFYSAMRIYTIKRIREGKYSSIYFILLPAIYFRQSIAVINRFYHIAFKL